MRVQYTLKPSTVEALTGKAESLDLPVSRLLEHIVSEWLLTGGPVVLRSAAAVTPTTAAKPHQSSTSPVYTRPTYGSSTQRSVTDDDEDTETCKDCACILPLSCFTSDGKTHLDCPSVGAGLLAQRRAAGLPPF